MNSEFENIFVFNRVIVFQGSTGAGFVYKHFIYNGVKSSLIVTAAHVLNRVKYKSITLTNGLILNISGYEEVNFPSKLLKKSDIGAIITCDLSEFIKPFPHALTPPLNNVEFEVVGYPQSKGGKIQQVTKGYIDHLNGIKIYSQFDSEFGFSGGPYINSKGEIFGIHHGRSRSNYRKGFLLTEYTQFLDQL